MIREAKAGVLPIRQRTQYSCMATSMCMALKSLGHKCDEDEVNKVMGATPLKGAAWEQALATAQHYGCRATLTSPSTVTQLQEWTDSGSPIMIAWNPEGREWSHASVVYDVTSGLPKDLDPSAQVIGGDKDGRFVWVADPNLPNPEKLVRVVHEDDFYNKWYEKWPKYLVRRPAMKIEREITSDGRQVMASKTASFRDPLNLPSLDSIHRDSYRAHADAHDHKVVKQQKADLEEYVEYNYGMTPMKAVEQWLQDNGYTGPRADRRKAEVADAMRRQLQGIARTIRRASPAVKDQYGKLFSPRRGLEGPFKYKTGVVLYYDPRENGGSYYDPSRDMYVTIEEFMSLTGEFPRKAYVMTAKDAAKWVRKLNGRYSEDLAAELSKSERSALLDYIIHTRMRTPRNAYAQAQHESLDAAQKVLLSSGRLASTLANRVASRYLSR